MRNGTYQRGGILRVLSGYRVTPPMGLDLLARILPLWSKVASAGVQRVLPNS
jgi:hypothetical protein